MSDGWAPAINDRIIYCGSRTDYNDQPGTITDIKVIEQCPSIVVILDTGQKVTTVRKTLRPERTMDFSTVSGELRSCANPLCAYKLIGGALYCCGRCAVAHDRGYEIHESGQLGHSAGCARRLPSSL